MLLHFQSLWSRLLTQPYSHYYSEQSSSKASSHNKALPPTYLFDQIKTAKTWPNSPTTFHLKYVTEIEVTSSIFHHDMW